MLSTALSVILLLLSIATTTATGGWRTTEELLSSSVVVAAIVEVAVAAGVTATICISTSNRRGGAEGYKKPWQYQGIKLMTPHMRSRSVATLMIWRPLHCRPVGANHQKRAGWKVWKGSHTDT